MTQYRTNNIIFRIASSDAISKFKASQAHAFIQLARKELKFDTSAREVVLLEYDRISQWLYKVERMLFGLEDAKFGFELRRIVSSGFSEEISTIESVMDSHREVFTKDVSQFTKIIHRYSTTVIISEIEDAEEDALGRSFSYISNLVTEYLQHLLACLHEYNNNCITLKDPAFISLSEFGLRYNNTSDCKFVPLLKRLDFFRKVTGQSSFVFKNYIENDDLLNSVVEALVDKAIELVPEIESVKEAA